MELLIRTADKHPVVSMMHETSSQQGDVIAAMPDGWAWSDAERSNPDWIIIHVDLTDIETDALMEAGRPGEPKYRRRLGVNIDGLKTGDKLTRNQLMDLVS